MSEERKGPGPVFICIAALSIAASGYIGAYVWMVQPPSYGGGIVHLMSVSFDPDYSANGPFLNAVARDQEFWGWFFTPIHEIDRRLRPNSWNAKFAP